MQCHYNLKILLRVRTFQQRKIRAADFYGEEVHVTTGFHSPATAAQDQVSSLLTEVELPEKSRAYGQYEYSSLGCTTISIHKIQFYIERLYILKSDTKIKWGYSRKVEEKEKANRTLCCEHPLETRVEINLHTARDSAERA